MVALAQGTKAPDISLSAADGRRYNLSEALRKHPMVLLSFSKASCPICQLTFPYLERLHRSYPNLPIWGVSQDDLDATTAFTRMYGCTFPMLLDESLSCTVDYGLNFVPSIFLIGSDMSILQATVGFSKADLEQINASLSQAAGLTLKPLFTAADEVPEFKPGCESKRPI